MLRTYIVKGDKYIPLVSRNQIKPGDIVVITDGKTSVFYKIDRLLPDKYINNWFNPNVGISQYKILYDKNILPYFTAVYDENTNLEGFGHFFHHITHSIGHIFHSIGHGISHVAHEVGHGVEHVVHEVGKHPILLLPATIAATAAIPGAIPAIGNAIKTVGSAIGIGGIAKTTASSIASTIAANAIGSSQSPEEIVYIGAGDLNMTPDQAQQVLQETQQYAQQNNMSVMTPYQQTLAYVSAHWGYFVEHGFKSPQAAAVYILSKTHGVPPNPNDDPSQFVEADISEQLKKYLPFIGIAALLLLIPKKRESKPEIIFLGGK